jgi:phosphonate transport system substrate-binding protein
VLTASRFLRFAQVSCALALITLASIACHARPEHGEVAHGPVAPPPPDPDAMRISQLALAAGRTNIRLAMVPVLTESQMRDQHGPLVTYLEETVGVPFELVVARSYGDAVDLIVEGTVDLALLPPASLAAARARSPSLPVLASQIASGSTSYSSYIVVRVDAELEGISDLAGRRLSLVDTVSTSGFYLPWAALLDAGLDPLADLGGIRFAGSHSAAIADVLEGRSDAAATYSGMLGFSERDRGADEAELRIIHKAGRVPGDAMCAAVSLPRRVQRAVAAALFALDTRSARGRAIYRRTSNLVSGWAQPDLARYDAVAAVMARVDAARNMAPPGGAR